MTGDPRPTLTVVVAATDSASAVAGALESLDGQGAEVIVVGEPGVAGPDPGTPPPGGSAPGIRRILAPTGAGVPRLRRLGLEAATGRVVAFTEDSCRAGPGWVDAWRSAFDDPGLAAGSGGVEHDASAPSIDWAVVFCEYAPFLPPMPGGPPPRLAGNNFAAPRDLALRLTGDEVHEAELLAAIRREGRAARAVEAATVRHVRRFGPRQAVVDRLRFGLEFGRLRARSLPTMARLAGPVAGPAILGAQVARLLGSVLRGRGHLGPFARALPITLTLLAAWSLGEWAGWCRGSLGPRPPSRR